MTARIPTNREFDSLFNGDAQHLDLRLAYREHWVAVWIEKRGEWWLFYDPPSL